MVMINGHWTNVLVKRLDTDIADRALPYTFTENGINATIICPFKKGQILTQTYTNHINKGSKAKTFSSKHSLRATVCVRRHDEKGHHCCSAKRWRHSCSPHTARHDDVTRSAYMCVLQARTVIYNSRTIEVGTPPYAWHIGQGCFC